jgi:isochorismate synthase EntC
MIEAPPKRALSWSRPDWQAFEQAFHQAQQLFESKIGLKAVARVFIEAQASDTWQQQGWVLLAKHLLEHPEPREHLFVAQEADSWFVFPTPETLFDRHGDDVSTMALAGTRTLDRVDELLFDPKERQEHQAVIEDLKEQLNQLSFVQRVEVGTTEVLKLQRLAHLHTPIRARLRSNLDFAETTRALVDQLHPSAALGVLPRNPAMQNWLRDHGSPKSPFGGPMGWMFPQKEIAWVGVGIRGVWMNDCRLHLGAGCGLVAASKLSLERHEIEQKLKSILDRMELE